MVNELGIDVLNGKTFQTTMKWFAFGLSTIFLFMICTTIASGQSNISGYSDVAKQR